MWCHTVIRHSSVYNYTQFLERTVSEVAEPSVGLIWFGLSTICKSESLCDGFVLDVHQRRAFLCPCSFVMQILTPSSSLQFSSSLGLNSFFI